MGVEEAVRGGGGGSSHGARGFDSLSVWHLSLQADGRRRKAVLRVELVFGPEEQLALFPSPQELEACLLGALDTVVESVLLVGGGACLCLATGGDCRGGQRGDLAACLFPAGDADQ